MKTEYLGLQIDLSRDELFDEMGLRRLKDSYMRPDEDSPQKRYAYIAKAFSTDHEHAQRVYDYASKHWLSFSTPILAFGRGKRSLPISCYLSHVDDSAEGLIEALAEINWLSMLGGGVGIGLGIRSSDDKSTGVMTHMKVYDASSLAYRQGKSRRGSYAAYLDISHPDIKQFLEIRKPTGDPNLRCLNMHHGVNITDDFMKIIESCMLNPDADDSWDLIDPHSKIVHETVSAKWLWSRILELRIETGEPYLHFIDTTNRALPQWLKDRGLSVNQSNLCSEITLPTGKDRTAVCCLSSANAVYWDQWSQESLFLSDVAEFLDNVLEYFINNAPPQIGRAVYSARMERSVGVGLLGFHSMLQAKSIPFEGLSAKILNRQIFKHIRTGLDEANERLGLIRGEAPDACGTGLRMSHLMALAPNATTAIIHGNVSPSGEPFKANVFRQDTMSGAFVNKNKNLEKLLAEKLPEDQLQDAWSSIIVNNGSVQHLDCLTDHEKDVYKTAIEIDQRWIVEHAADRQEFIDQAQSVNLFFRPDVGIPYLHAVHFSAWKKGLKTLYYCRSESVGSADKVYSKISRDKIEEVDIASVASGEECVACQ